MNYILILIIILLITIQTMCFKEFNRTYMKNLSSYFIFNFFYFFIVVIIFLISGISVGNYARATVVLGLTYGFTFIITIFSYMKGMETGPMSFTVLFNSFGIIIPVLCGLVFWNEGIDFKQIIGLILLLTTFYLGSGSSKDSAKKVNGKWLVFCTINFLTNGFLMAIVKWHQILLPGREVKEFLTISFGTAAILSLLAFLYYYFIKKQEISHLKSVGLGAMGIVAGVTTAFGNQLGVYLASRIPSVIQFPLVSGGIVICSTIASAFIFKDKLTKNGIAGMGIGIISLILLSAK